MKILVINSGSSSIKFQVFAMPDKNVVVRGMTDRIGLSGSTISYKSVDKEHKSEVAINNHKEALHAIVDLLTDHNNGFLADKADVKVVAHRVVHGGPISKTSFITPEVKSIIKKYQKMAPLHNPANLMGLETAEMVFPAARQIAVFDTAFHTTIPQHAHQFAIPQAFYEEEGIRVYGFHGTSHEYVFRKYQEYNPSNADKVISLHLGNGCSITAIRQGKSVDHSLGFSPLSGLVMGTRCGDLDPTVVTYLAEKHNLSLPKVNQLLNKESGMLGLTGSSDIRTIENQAKKGDQASIMALDLATYRIKKYIGAYAAAMNGLEGIIFTGGIGENSSHYRKLICQNMDFLGIYLDSEKNKNTSSEYYEIQKGKKVILSVIATNEELAIASQAYTLAAGL